MKVLDAPTLALLSGTNEFALADLVSIWLWRPATQDYATTPDYRWTGATINITVGGRTFSSLGPAIDSGRDRREGNLSIDTRDVELQCGSAVLVGGLPLQLQSARSHFRRARILVERAFQSSPGATPAGATPEFEGRVSDVEGTSTSVLLRCATDLEVCDTDHPRFTFAAQCQNAWGDALCGLGGWSKATYTFSFTVTSGQTPTTAAFATGLSPPADPRGGGGNWGWGAGYYGRGVVTFAADTTTAALRGLSRTVDHSAAGVLSFTHTWPVAPAVGDTGSVVLGCDQTAFQCRAKFGTAVTWPNHRGFATVPRGAQ